MTGGMEDMTKHYSPPEFEIIELRLKDVIMQSDEWETPILGGFAPQRGGLEQDYSPSWDEELPPE